MEINPVTCGDVEHKCCKEFTCCIEKMQLSDKTVTVTNKVMSERFEVVTEESWLPLRGADEEDSNGAIG